MTVAPGSRSLTALFAAASLLLVFPCLLLFYGAQTNLFMLALPVTLLVVAAVAGLRLLPVGRVEAMLVAAVALVLVLTQLASQSPETSFPVTWVLALAPLAYVLGRVLGDLLVTVWWWLTAMVVCLVVVSLQRLLVEGERPGLPLADYNNFASLLYVFVLPAVFHRVHGAGLQNRVLRAGVVLLLVLVPSLLIAATGSRAGLWVLVGGVVVIAAAAWRDPVRRRSAVVSLLAVLAGVFAFQFGLDRSDSSLPSAETLGSGLGVRATLVEAAWSMRPDNPLTGLGLLAFPLFYRQVRGPDDPDTAGLFVHNDYVQFLVEGGLPLLLPVFALWVLVAKGSRPLLLALRSASGVPATAGGCALALGGLLLHALVNFVFYTAVLAFLAGLLAAAVVNARESRQEGPSARRTRWLLLPPAGLALLGLGYLWLDVASAAILQGQPGPAWVREIAADPARQLRFSYLAQDLNADRGTPFLLAALLTSQWLGGDADPGAEARALQSWRQALAADRWNTHGLWLFRAFLLEHPQLHAALHADERPDRLLERMLVLDPIFVPAIDATLSDLARGPSGIEAQAAFLDRQLDGRLTWLARENHEAAMAYAGFLVANAPSSERQRHWAGIAQEVEQVQPLQARRWLF